MRYLLLVLILVSCMALSGVDLVSADFASALPAGWTQMGSTSTHWEHSATNNAGGTTGELGFTWSPSENGTFRFVSPAFNTTMAHDMTLSFKQAIDWYANSFTLSVQISTNLTTWNTIWSSNVVADVAAQTVNAQAPWNWGNSSTTYLAFVYSGNTYNINNWWIDNVSLSYTNTLGTGTWSAATYYPTGDLIVPNGQTLTIQPGVTINMASNSILSVQGSLKALGTGTQKINITTTGATTTWAGIDIQNVAAANDSTILDWCVIQRSIDSGVEIVSSPKIRISNCEIKNCSVTGTGGAIRAVVSNIEVKGCFIQANSSTQDGSAVCIESSSPRFHHNRILLNNLTVSAQHGALTFKTCDLNNVIDNIVVNNSFNGTGAAIYLYNCSGTFKRHLVANNSSIGIWVNNSISSNWMEIDHIDIVNNGYTGLVMNGYVRLKNSIVWGNSSSDEINNMGPSNRLQVSYCCVRNGAAGIVGEDPLYFLNNISSNPLFVNPTESYGTGYDAYSANWRLQDLSPCIDAGDGTTGEYDLDFSPPDIGLYTRKLKPTIYSAADLYPDQGHQIDLRWYPNEKDTSWDPSSWYHVFRWSDDRVELGEDALVVSDPREISPDLAASNSKIYWIHNNRILTYLGQVKAMNRNTYSLIVPTIQDSSATGLHEEVFVVTYFDTTYYWDSIGMSGYSVDNIPPMTPQNAALSRISPTNFRLDWNEVTEGTWQGNSYPETNPITYLIYASDNPEFIPGPQNFLMQTSEPSVILNSPGALRKFYRIIASDSQ